jgi:hypothetical protein
MARQETLAQNCDQLVAEGAARRVMGSAIELLPPKTAAERVECQRRYDETNQRYGETFDRLWQEHKQKEREAEKRFRDFTIDF